MKKYITVLFTFFVLFVAPVAFAGVVDLTTGTKEVREVSV